MAGEDESAPARIRCLLALCNRLTACRLPLASAVRWPGYQPWDAQVLHGGSAGRSRRCTQHAQRLHILRCIIVAPPPPPKQVVLTLRPLPAFPCFHASAVQRRERRQKRMRGRGRRRPPRPGAAASSLACGRAHTRRSEYCAVLRCAATCCALCAVAALVGACP